MDLRKLSLVLLLVVLFGAAIAADQEEGVSAAVEDDSEVQAEDKPQIKPKEHHFVAFFVLLLIAGAIWKLTQRMRDQNRRVNGSIFTAIPSAAYETKQSPAVFTVADEDELAELGYGSEAGRGREYRAG
uniref:Transmembrane protein n=1 Tax=Rhodosorus marinus TaxID=101924 RepID=A0A7S3A223_9RHOD|mmetsp:Transcript_37790/g.150708  ORF Transcript_37790/g.150708 Transcript_37790/m.150708 type:complete len:129 (+) Transcript_37790:162-548(+)|eukprot:CAMPEP_0113959206 /NCGR_PEP_ID=MMETSP0011_2-20120614/4009_1 /TAXON_ID=101924 /ORGANISM="Rhodosorus marinus" /LENGTH=128 /DNA_ID=CAMNT_0000970479 /DNA_START=250 /DNA_END=636 /DNA_ORIENTATION=- /assembly_acc=CAM_ASM_000156